MTLSKYLKERSKEICSLNGCTEDNHYCESYAYINRKIQLMDICSSDYFQGCSSPHAAISLPWHGTQKELKNEVLNQCFDYEN